MAERILVIKLSALGDFIQAMGPFAAIRRHHAGAHITLLTTPAYAGLGRACGHFDEVWEDRRPRAWQVGRWLELRQRILDAGFRRVYDLQTSDRTGFYFRMLWPRRPEWSGVAAGCSHPHQSLDRTTLHTIDRQAGQLRLLGIVPPLLGDLSWMTADVTRFGLDSPYVLLVPGAAPHRPAKRWPAEAYAGLARRLLAAGTLPVMLGTAAEEAIAAQIMERAPGTRSLIGRTDLVEIAVLARGAIGAVGNDTGPMHLVAMSNCPSVVLFSAESRPELCAPRGRSVCILKCDDLAGLGVDEVTTALRTVVGQSLPALEGLTRCG